MMSISYFKTALGFLKFHAEASLALAESTGATPSHDLYSPIDPAEELCRGILIGLFEQEAQAFCASDEHHEMLLSYEDHPSAIIDGMIEEVVSRISESRFRDSIAHEADRRNITIDPTFTQMYFENLEKYALRVLSEIYKVDFEAQRISDEIHRKFMPPREPI